VGYQTLKILRKNLHLHITEYNGVWSHVLQNINSYSAKATVGATRKEDLAMILEPKQHNPSHSSYRIKFLIVIILISFLALCSCAGTPQIIDRYSGPDHTPGNQATLILSSQDFRLIAIDGVDDSSMNKPRLFTDYRFLITPGHHIITFYDEMPGVNNNDSFVLDYIFSPGQEYVMSQFFIISNGVQTAEVYIGNKAVLSLPVSH